MRYALRASHITFTPPDSRQGRTASISRLRMVQQKDSAKVKQQRREMAQAVWIQSGWYRVFSGLAMVAFRASHCPRYAAITCVHTQRPKVSLSLKLAAINKTTTVVALILMFLSTNQLASPSRSLRL
jgi:hypothetical protein